MAIDDSSSSPSGSPGLPGSESNSPALLREEVLFLLLDTKTGTLMPVAPWAFACAMSGATLMDLSILGCIDTDTDQLILLNTTPTGDTLLDTALTEIGGVGATRSTRYWLDRFIERAEEIKEASLEALIDRGILLSHDGFLEFARPAAPADAEPTTGYSTEREVRLRIIRCLTGDDIPSPRDAMLISLADACGILSKIFAPSEIEVMRPRIDLVSRMDMIGRSVTTAIWEVEPPARKQPVRSGKPIPEAPGLPLLGNTFGMARDTYKYFLDLYERLGPVFRVRTPGHRYIVLAGVEANRFITRHGNEYLRSDRVWHGMADSMGASRMMPGMDGHDHIKFRRIQRDGFARSVLEDRIGDAVSIVRKEVESWGMAPVPVVRTMQRIVTEQLGTIIASTSAGEFIDDLVVFVRTMLMVRLAHARPSVWLWMPRFRRARGRVLELFTRVRTTHLERPSYNQPDLIDMLIELHEEEPQFFPETDHVIAMLGPYIAGLDTVAASCAFALYALFQNPDVRQKMTTEADAFFAGGPATGARLKELDVAPRVVLETLRMYPLGPGILRHAANSFEFEGYTIQAGEAIIAATMLPHYLPECFPEPYRFDIDRYTPANRQHKKPGAFAPFGVGPHSCLGSAFAETQVALNLLTILHTAELDMHPPGYRLRIKQTPTRRPCNRFSLRVKTKR
jgi:cytochrome P450